MSQTKVIVLRTAGTNCDQETVHAWELAGAKPQRVHVRELIDRPNLLDEFGILTIPGGFSYGDDISAGKILAGQLVHHLSEALARFVAAGKLVLGICNGFQVLVKAGLLPGSFENGAPAHAELAMQTSSPLAMQASNPLTMASSPLVMQASSLPLSSQDGRITTGRQAVTLTQNDSAKFEDRWIHLRSASVPSAFLPADAILEMPIAHGEGKLVARDDGIRRLIQSAHRIALTYCDAEGKPGPYPTNPNGSECDIAGLVDATGRVLGLMPHPERHVHPTQHPLWTRRPNAQADGRIVFETAVRTAKGS